MASSMQIVIKETSVDDLENILTLVNNGVVMKYVGYPDGLGVSLDDQQKWFKRAIQKPICCHYSIYTLDHAYYREIFYAIDSHNGGMLDIKLLPAAQSKGIACQALAFVIGMAFEDGKADRVYVDPHPDNHKAWALYARIGFSTRPHPEYLEAGETYLEIMREEWLNPHSAPDSGKTGEYRVSLGNERRNELRNTEDRPPWDRDRDQSRD